MREDPVEVAAKAAYEAHEDGLRSVRTKLAMTLRNDVAEALSCHADWFVEPVITDAVGKYYDGRRTNDTWVVRDKEINMIAALTPVAGAIASVAGPASLAVALLSAVAGLMYTFRAKKIELSERDFALLMFLKDRGPIREYDLLAGLNEIRATTQFTWNAEGLKKDLVRLQKVTLGDGTVDALVAQASDERWSANGI